MILDVNTQEFTRWTEVENYAFAHELSLQEAIIRLVNAGLSHQSVSYTSR
jgi:hypothetical protein